MSDSIHLIEDGFQLYLCLHALFLSSVVKFRTNRLESLATLRYVDNHHHVEEAMNNGLVNVKNVNVALGKVGTYMCYDSNRVFPTTVMIAFVILFSFGNNVGKGNTI